MASEIDICNLALTHLGHTKTISAIVPPDGSREAAYCARFYPIARDATLEMREWGFATKRRTLGSLGTPPVEWDYRYAMPSGLIRPLRIFVDGADVPEEFVVESDDSGTVIYTNAENAVLHYTARIEDTTKFSPAFVVSLSWELAAELAGALTGDLKLAEFCRQQAQYTIGNAAAYDANTMRKHTRSEIARRYPIGRPRGNLLTDGS